MNAWATVPSPWPGPYGRKAAWLPPASIYVYTALDTGRPAAVPAGLRQQIERQARGEDSFELIEGNWSELQGPAYAVREAVFIKEQGIDAAEELDADDAVAHHVVVQTRAGMALATGRLIPQRMDCPGWPKLGAWPCSSHRDKPGWANVCWTTSLIARAPRATNRLRSARRWPRKRFTNALALWPKALYMTKWALPTSA